MHASNAAAAYAKVSTTVLGPRSIEQKVFRQVTGLLSAANDGENVPMSRIADAVYRNSQLWTLLAADVASEGNALDPALRGRILSLALYSQRTGQAVLRKEASLDALIEINTAIMQGLEGVGEPASSNGSIQ